MSQIIFLKEQFGMVLFYKDGDVEKQIPFHEVGSDIGGIKLETDRAEDKPVIAALEQMIKDHVGGVYLATEEQYEAKKKLPPWRPSNPQLEPLAIFQPNRFKPVTARPEDVAAAGEQPPAPPTPRHVTINPALAQDLTRPSAPAGVPPAESGAEPPAAPPRLAKPRVGRASQKASPEPTAATPASA